MKVVPLAAVPAQQLVVALGGQRCTIRIYQRRNYAGNRAPLPAAAADAELGTEDAQALLDEQGAALQADVA